MAADDTVDNKGSIDFQYQRQQLTTTFQEAYNYVSRDIVVSNLVRSDIFPVWFR